jgi:flagellar biosynthesis protein FlhF
MKIKSYYARTVEDAMAAARQEMGSEAMLVNSRKTPGEARHLGEYEVVFATVGGSGTATEASLSLFGETAAAPSTPPSDRLSVEVAELKRELEGMRRAITRTAPAPAQWVGVSQDVSDAYAALTGADVSPELARDVVQSAGNRLNGQHQPMGRAQRIDGGAFERALLEELGSRFTVDATLGRGAKEPRIAVLAGPPGSGKTTALVKLAVTYGLAARRPVLLLSMDTYRVAAAEQLRSYAAILGVGFQVIETIPSLAQTIEENRGKELILIDTPGLGYGELEDSGSLGHFLSTRTDIDTHLVLSASMKPADLVRMVDAFEILRPQHLLFTKLDETSSYGPILSEAARTGKPLSFFTDGQRIPEDLEAASSDRLLSLVLPGCSRKAKSAA